jgi:threonine dehydrogenase-like Zn-dependent dehydrogenase
VSLATVRAVHLENGKVTVKEASIPDRPAAFALIRVLCAGICNTDLELQRGYSGFAGTPGHEFVGEVVECDSEIWHGRRVVGEINLNCGHCEWCRRRWGRHCPHRTVLGIVKHPGAFAEYVLLPERNLHAVPEELANEQAVFIEPLAAACEILDQVDFPKRARVAVLGDGKLGLLIAQVLQAHGLHAVQYGRHSQKLKISAEAGIETVAGDERPQKLFDFVIDSTGSREGLKEAVAMARPRGTVILKSTVHGEVPIDTAPVIVDELTLVGSRCGRIEPAIALLRAGRVKTAALISAEFRLEKTADAFAEAATRGVLKVLLRP